MTRLAELDRYCVEASDIVRRAEDVVRSLTDKGACEGHRLMANQALVAMQRLERLIEGHRRRLPAAPRPHAVAEPPPRRSWWPALGRGAGPDAARA
ncbi:hypothetical protein ACRBEV_14100 [Methylobacterium phyllosphaerae]